MAFVTQVENDTGGTSGTTIAITINPTAGNTLTVIVGYFNAASQTVSLSDGGVTTFTQRQTFHDTTDDYGLALFTAVNVAAGSRTLTATIGASSTYRGIYSREDDNIASYDTSANFNRQAAPGTGANAVVSNSATPGGAESRAQIAFSFNYGWTGPPTAGTGFTSRATVWDAAGEAGANQARSEDRVITSAAATTATFTATGNNEHYTVQVIYLQGSPATPAAASITAAAVASWSGAATKAAAASISAAATVSWVGTVASTIVPTEGSFVAAGAMTWQGRAVAGSAFSIVDAQAQMTPQGAAIAAAALSAQAQAVFSPAGAAVAASAWSVQAQAALSATGTAIVGSAWSVTALAAASWFGTGIFGAGWSQIGAGTVTWVGAAETPVAGEAAWSVAAASAASWRGASIAGSAFASQGAGAVTWDGQAVVGAALAVTSVAVAEWVGASVVAATASGAAQFAAVGSLRWVGRDAAAAADDESGSADDYARIMWEAAAQNEREQRERHIAAVAERDADDAIILAAALAAAIQKHLH